MRTSAEFWLAEPIQPPKYKPAVKHCRWERRMREMPVWKASYRLALDSAPTPA